MKERCQENGVDFWKLFIMEKFQIYESREYSYNEPLCTHHPGDGYQLVTNLLSSIATPTPHPFPGLFWSKFNSSHYFSDSQTLACHRIRSRAGENTGCWAPLPEFPIQLVWSGGWECLLLTSFQVMLMLQNWEPHLKKHGLISSVHISLLKTLPYLKHNHKATVTHKT